MRRQLRPIGNQERALVRWAAGCILLAGALGFSGCESEEPQIPLRDPSTRVPDQQIMDFVLTETEGGRQLWVLKAERAKIFDSSNEINLDSLVVDFFDETEAPLSRLTSRSGVINRTTRDMEAFGNVVIVTEDGLRLESEEVRWRNRAGRIMSDAAVRFTRGKNVLTGVGFVSDPSLENIEILEEIRAEVRDPEDLRKGDAPEPES